MKSEPEEASLYCEIRRGSIIVPGSGSFSESFTPKRRVPTMCMRKATILSSMVVILGWALWFLPTLPASNDPSMDSEKVSELL